MAEYAELREDFKKLTVVLQGEQDRAAAEGVTLAADRARVEDLANGLQLIKIKQQQDIHTFTILRAGINAADQRLDQQAAKLGNHDEMLTSQGDRLLRLEASLGSLGEQIAQLESGLGQTSSTLQVVVSASSAEASALLKAGSDIQQLERRFDEQESRLVALAARHEETAGSLRGALDLTLAPALDRAEVERSRLDATTAALEKHEARVFGQGEVTARLEAEVSRATAEQDALAARMQGLEDALRVVEQAGECSQTAAAADHAVLGEAQVKAEAMQTQIRDTEALLRRTRAEVVEARSEVRQNVAQVDKLGEAVAALEQGVRDTDGEVYDLRALLGVVRSEE